MQARAQSQRHLTAKIRLTPAPPRHVGLLTREGGGGGVLPGKRLLGMCRWMGSHFHNWTDYNGVTFLVELLEWGRKFSGFLG